MEEVLTVGQKQLVKYFKAIGMTLVETMSVAMSLWDERATVEMLKYLLETHDTNVESVCKIASQISKKYPLIED